MFFFKQANLQCEIGHDLLQGSSLTTKVLHVVGCGGTGGVPRQAPFAGLEELAHLGGVCLTPHAIAIERAMAAVAAVNEAIDKMGASAELREINQAFKDARKADA